MKRFLFISLSVFFIMLLPVMVKAGGSIAKRSSRYFREQQSALGDLNGYRRQIRKLMMPFRGRMIM